ncbi:MAG: hypothetical protein AAGJ18_20505 [Bacteroidota bacterium]
METRNIQLFFLIVVGSIISWREWTSMVSVAGIKQQLASTV